MRAKVLVFSFCFLLAKNPAVAQQCDWLVQGLGTAENTSYMMALNDSDDVFVGGDFKNQLQIGDTLFERIESATNTVFHRNSFISKYSENGVWRWSVWIKYDTSSVHRGSLWSITCDREGNTYALGSFDKSVDFGGGHTMSCNSVNENGVFLVKYDPSGNPVWTREMIGRQTNSWFGNSYLGSVTADVYGNVIIAVPFSWTLKPDGAALITTTRFLQKGLAILKYTEQGQFVWSQVYESSTNFDRSNHLDTDAEANIYWLTINPDSLTAGIGMKTGKGAIVIKLDSAGNKLAAMKIMTSMLIKNARLSVFEDGRVAVLGDFADTVEADGVTLCRTSTSSHAHQFLALLKPDLHLNWIFQNTGPGSGMPTGVSVRDNHIYFGGYGGQKEQFGGFTIPDNPYVGNGFYFVKVDTLKNVLWAFGGPLSKGPSAVRDVATDSYGNGLFAGEFYDTLRVFNKMATADPNFPNFYAAKIVDYTITRGYVYPGPYCAGDSIFIPFEKTGTYDTGNMFIAQLSDSTGSFDHPIELGRLADTTGGIIRGTLPLVDVATDNRYRIRVLSTLPGVTSFYKRDTLRLLIFSRDTANAGDDIVLCKGQSTQLSVSGGSKWHWTPSWFVQNPGDTARRSVRVTPDSTTEYRITISDSSGCGLNDTDYVKVFVRPPLQSVITGKSDICFGHTTVLKAQVSGGDSSRYHFIWQKDSAQGFATVQEGRADSISVAPREQTLYRLIVYDSCSAKPDTSGISVFVDSLFDLSTNEDTLVCVGETILLRTMLKSCDTSGISYRWNRTGDTAVLSTSASWNTLVTDSSVFRLIVSNTVGQVDTALVTVDTRDSLKVSVSGEDTVCKGDKLFYMAHASGGNMPGYAFSWTDSDNNPLSTGDKIEITPSESGWYRVILNDACSQTAKDSFHIASLPLPIADFESIKTVDCSPMFVELKDLSTGHDTTLNRWYLNSTEILGGTSPTYLLHTAGSYDAWLKVSNAFGCSDSLFQKDLITVYAPPIAKLLVLPDTQEREKPVVLVNQSTGAVKLLFDEGIGNGLIFYSGSDTTITYPDTGNYQVKLVAINRLGCTDTFVSWIRIREKMQCFIPNSFTPNGDIHNPYFAPYCEGANSYTLNIYTRWGELLLSCENCYWDGTFKGLPVPEGSYMYLLEFSGGVKRKEFVSGMVTLIR